VEEEHLLSLGSDTTQCVRSLLRSLLAVTAAVGEAWLTEACVPSKSYGGHVW